MIAHRIIARNADAADRLVASFPPGIVDRDQLFELMPWVLECALRLLLDDIDADTGSSSAQGARIIAGCIARLSEPLH